ncbi:hypothetical protein SUGI_0700170 [Cryptomeria japonica]|nr:hypothetical protein SUGI_0700170 [Cryptomeria japonica]
MKPGLAFIVSVSFLHWVLLFCHARPIKVPTSAVPIPSPAFAPIISTVSTGNLIETASYKDGYAEPLRSMLKRNYASYKTNENDDPEAPPRMSHQQGHSPGVGHSNPYSRCC